MQFKKYTNHRGSIQGLRSFKDTLPKNIKKFISKKGHIYSETLNNWKLIVGDKFFKICYPKSFKDSNKLGVSTLVIMVKRGYEVDLEYSKNEIIEKMNNFFGYSVIKKLKLTSFDNEIKNDLKEDDNKIMNNNVTNNKYKKKVIDVKNEKIKKSLLKLSEVFREK